MTQQSDGQSETGGRSGAVIQPDPRHPLTERLVERLEPRRQCPGMWPQYRSVPVSVLIPVKNEQRNIVECIRHLNWADEIVVVDSQSTDLTVPMSQAMGADVYQFRISAEGWPKKKNWALQHVPWRNEWVLIMDADEHCTPELAAEVRDVVTGNAPAGNGCGDGYWINRRFMFMGRWIKHCGYFPSWNVRLFKHPVGRYERILKTADVGAGDMEVHEHVILSTGEPGYLQNAFLHYAYPDLTTWVEKHNRYATWEAHLQRVSLAGGGIRPRLIGSGPVARNRWIRMRTHRMPFRPTLRFIYSYIVRLGFLDGYPGFVLSRLIGWYDFLAVAKSREMEFERRRGRLPEQPALDVAALDLPEPASASDGSAASPAMPAGSSASGGDDSETASMTHIPPADSPARSSTEPTDAAPTDAEVEQATREATRQDMTPDDDMVLDHSALEARLISPWSFWDKVRRQLWYITQCTLFRFSPRTAFKWRVLLLKIFGAKIHWSARLRSTVNIEIPWHLSIGAYTAVGDHAILYSLGRIRIGNRVLISQYSHLCAGTHDYTRIDMPLQTPPIIIEDDVWVAADAFVGPGLKVGRGAIVGSRASVFKDVPDWAIVGGNPGKYLKQRRMNT